ncbi:MAG: leucine-rich repeat domain-containing protein [Ruminococcaceae bacterium]|nr:leucine-rich repeat domain-containing protein [Oscillospiraceae bacterium]
MKKPILLLLLLLLSGCAAAETPPAPTPEPTPIVTPTPMPTPTPIPTPEPLLIHGQSFDISAGSVDLRGVTLSNGEKLALMEAYPDLRFHWEVDVLGVTVDSADEYICLDNIPMTDTAELEALLPLLPHVKKIDMCGCGIGHEEMYQLNQRHEGIRFIWVAPMGSAALRTDITYFNQNDMGMLCNLYDARLEEDLRYFPDLIALDLGHSTVAIQRCDWLRHTPKLQYLILADCMISDVTAIGELQDLRYLELFTNAWLEDITPLGKLRKLEALNLSVTGIRDIVPLESCSALRSCWLNCCWNLPYAAVESFAAKMPDCLINCASASPTSGGWREQDIYFEMRDAFHSAYMNGDDGRTNILNPG